MTIEAQPVQLGLGFENEPREAAASLAKSPLALRLAALEKERDKLLRSIERKKLALDASLEQVRRLAHEVFNLVQPLRERALAYAQEIADLFRSLLGPQSRLSTRDKRKVRAVYDDLRDALALDELIAICEQPPAPAADDPGANRGPTGGGTPSDANRGRSANKPTGKNAGSVTALFRKLALALHPDRVREESEKAKRTELMREVTRAYEQGDLAQLLHLERVWLERGDVQAADGEQAAHQRIEELVLMNQQLRRQLRLLRKEEKSIRSTSPGTLDERGRFHPAPDLQMAVDDMERELVRLDQVVQFTRRFEAGAVTLQEFCAGPDLELDDEFGDPDDEDLDALLIEFLEEGLLDDLMQDLRAPHAKSGRRRKGPRKRKRQQTRAR